jgi:proline dehydrogenase
LLRHVLLMLARSHQVKEIVTRLPVSSGIVNRYVPGEQTAQAVDASRVLIEDGLHVTLDFLGEDTLDEAQAEATVVAYLELLDGLSHAGLARNAEVSVKLSAIGQALPEIGPKTEDHTTTDSTLAALHELRKDFPETGAVLQAYLYRTEQDCRALAHEGSRVRLCKGAYKEPEEVAYQDRHDVDKSYVRCLKILMAGEGYPMVATHDPRLVKIASALATRNGRMPGTYEFQMLFGIRGEEQKRLAEAGEKVRVYLPYGQEWYGYLMRRLAERPQNLTFFLRSLVSQK